MSAIFTMKVSTTKGGLKSEETGTFLHLQDKYSKSLFWAENLNFPPKTVNNLFNFFPQDSDLECLFWRSKHSQVSSDLKPPLLCTTVWLSCEWAFKISKQIFVTFFFLLKKHLTRKFHHWLESWFNFPFKKGHTFYQIKCDILGRELWPGTLTFRISSILLACLGLHWPACLVCLGRLVCFVQSALACPLSSWGRAMYPRALMLTRPWSL